MKCVTTFPVKLPCVIKDSTSANSFFCLNRVDTHILMLLRCQFWFLFHFIQVHNLVLGKLEMAFNPRYNFAYFLQNFFIRLKRQLDVFLEKLNEANITTQIWGYRCLIFPPLYVLVIKSFSCNIYALENWVWQII